MYVSFLSPRHRELLLISFQECYTSLVENLDIGDVKCLKYSLSKGLGIGIVVGGSIMKVPQILLSELSDPYPKIESWAKIVRNRSPKCAFCSWIVSWSVHSWDAFIRHNPRILVQKSISIFHIRRKPILNVTKCPDHPPHHLVRSNQPNGWSE